MERRLGTGGMASVWAAYDERLDRRVAIKLVADGLAHDPQWLERFRREARVAASVTHPGVVRIFDAGVEDGRPYLVMAHLEGRDLGRILRDPDGEAPDPHRLAAELLSALGAVHAAGIVHRDVKAGNVLIGPDGRARLIDFGIARPDDATALTSVGLVIGTPRYMAPEVAAGLPASPASDLYAVGVLLRDVCGAHGPSDVLALCAALTRAAPEARPPTAEAALARLHEEPADATAATLPIGARPAAAADASPSAGAPTRAHHLPDAAATSTATGPRRPRPVARRPAADRSLRARRAPHRRPRVLFAVAAFVLLLGVLAAVAWPRAGDDRAVPAAAPAAAPLTEQLDALRRGVDAAARP